ncbi:MAG: hypothetical protein D6732_05125 [Methanobacteriota archaeon]|nr:MAG: hypothetical protein D6732_05125 [Euryarchaeota archaeon]
MSSEKIIKFGIFFYMCWWLLCILLGSYSIAIQSPEFPYQGIGLALFNLLVFAFYFLKMKKHHPDGNKWKNNWEEKLWALLVLLIVSVALTVLQFPHIGFDMGSMLWAGFSGSSLILFSMSLLVWNINRKK